MAKSVFKFGFWILLLFGIWNLGFGISAQAQGLFTGIYWINGTIEAPSGNPSLSTENRMVVFYQISPEAGYTYDFSGTGGLSGRSGEFMLNALDDWRMTVTPGASYQIAVVNGDDNYGVDPIIFEASGNGWDTVGPLVLAEGAGIASPEARALPPGLASGVPVYERIWFDDRVYQKQLVLQGMETIVTETPKIAAKVIASSVGINPNSLSILMDEGLPTAKTFPIDSSHFSPAVTDPNPTEIQFVFDFATEGETLGNGEHEFKFSASNALGTTIETASVSVMVGAAQLVGTPITYPSPVSLSQHNSVTLQYGLSKDTDIDISIYDLTGTSVKKLSFNAGEPGGSAGGEANPNKVSWNLISDQGGKIGVGIYIWPIVDRKSGKLLGAGKLAAGP